MAERSGITPYVRQIASERGVTERTVWRWVARAKVESAFPKRRTRCAYCSAALPLTVTLRRRFCSDRCRIYSHRGRPPVGLSKLKPVRRPPLTKKEERRILEVLGFV
jgi:hypothetical protein